jgi:hypothetical protein
MRILTFIEDEEVIEKMLKLLGLWDLKFRPSPKVKVPAVTIAIDDSDYQFPFSTPSFYSDPDHPVDSYRISKPHGVTPMVENSAIFFAFPKFQKAKI